MKTEVDEIESNIKDDLKEIKLSKEEKEHISKVVNRLFRMKAKKRLRTIANIITYPIYKNNI
jgi:hypothetical protein